MRIIIEAVARNESRYPDVAGFGDWFEDADGNVRIQVDASLSPDEQFLVALHELVEVKLCIMRGISQAAVDDFDFGFKGEGEPGDDPAAPYRAEHRQAMLIEHMMANFMGLTDYGMVK